MKLILTSLLLLLAGWTSAQEADSLPFTLYKERVVLYSDLGFNAAPFNFHDDFLEGETKLKFRHNVKATIGLGIAYKWFGLRVGFGLPGQLRPESRYGNSKYRDLGIKFNVKKLFWEVDLRNYEGYVIKDAYEWNDTLNALSPNLFRPLVRSINISVDTWYLHSDKFKMAAVRGQVGHYEGPAHTWYVKGTLNFFGIGDDSGPLVPEELIDSTATKSAANSATALELGAVPGYAYVNRISNWQFSVFGGVGGVIQSKLFTVGQLTRGFVGLAPRIDLRFIAGYSKPDYFFWLVTDFDVKSVRYQEMRFGQTYYSVKVVGGVRLKNKKPSEKSTSKVRKKKSV